MSLIKMLFMTGGVLALGLTASGSARAATCAADSECPQGFACVVSGYATSGPSCDSKSGCPADATPTSGSTTEIKECQPKTCATDADCGGGTFCHSETLATCSGGAASAPCKQGDANCVSTPPTETTCTTTTSNHCAFHWQFPCQVDADCGEGFTCTPSVVTACSGGSGVASSGGVTGSTGQGGSAAGNSSGSGSSSTSATPIPPDQCTTTTTYPGSCQPKVTFCASDGDCPQAWTCSVAPPTRGIGTPVPTDVGGSGGSISAVSDPAPTAVPAAKTCTSPFGYGSYGGVRATDGASTGTGGTTGGTASGSNQGEATNPTAPPSGSGGTLGTGTKTVDHATNDVAGGGCSISSRGGSATLWSSVGLLGVLALRLRRRRG